MSYVVSGLCIGDKSTKCVDVCPVEAFREGPDMLYIDPNLCIECNACLTECPSSAIFPDKYLPEDMTQYIAINAENAKIYPPLTESYDVRLDQGKNADKRIMDKVHRVAIIGSGPSAFYSAEEILKISPNAVIDMFERLPTPFGLVRYGVAPDHQKIKSVTAGFTKIAQSKQVRFFGNVTIGSDIKRDDLVAYYDSIIYATGGSKSKALTVPGSDSRHVIGSSDFVNWYNGHPDHANLNIDLSGAKVVIVGIGNVAMDIARILTMPVALLEKTDIADHALAALKKSNVKEVVLLARRGALQATFTPKELVQLTETPGIDLIVDPNDVAFDVNNEKLDGSIRSRELKQNIELLQSIAQQAMVPSDNNKIRFIFQSSPVSFTGLEYAQAEIRVEENGLTKNSDGSYFATATGNMSKLSCDLVISATGYQGSAIKGVEYDSKKTVIKNVEGRVVLKSGVLSNKEYTTGWIKRGANGVIGTNKPCAVETVQHVMTDVVAKVQLVEARNIETLLIARDINYITFEDWLHLDKHEKSAGYKQGRPRKKLVDVAEMLSVIADKHTEIQAEIDFNQAVDDAQAQVKLSEIKVGNVDSDIKTHFRTCSICEAMCGVQIEYKGTEIVSVKGDKDDPHSSGHICPKGYSLQDLHNDPDRLTSPMKRIGKTWHPISWEQAFDEVAANINSLQDQYGNDAVTSYWGNPSVHNLGAALKLGPFRKALANKNTFSASSLDQMPHQLVSHLMYGHEILFTIPDIDKTDYMLMLGANPAASNGSLMSAGNVLERLEAIPQRGGKFVIIDPRRTETVRYATDHHFIQPGTDALFLLGLIQVIIDKGLTKPGRLTQFIDNWDEISVFVNLLSMSDIATATGITEKVITEIAIDFCAVDKAVCYGRMGIATQEFGALNHWLIQVINIITGNLDKPGGSLFSTPAIDLPATSSRGHFDRYRSRVNNLPEFGGEFPVSTMADEILTPGKGQIRSLITIAGNPVISVPNSLKLEKALEQLDFMVSIDFYLTETTKHAHIILPPTGMLEHSHYDVVFNLFAVRDVAKFSSPLFKAGPNQRSDGQILQALTQRIRAHKEKSKKISMKDKITRFITDSLTTEQIIDLGLRTGPYGIGLNPLNLLNPAKQGLTLKELKKHPHGMDLGALKPSLPKRLFTKNKKINFMPEVLKNDLVRLKSRFENTQAIETLVLIGRRDLRTNNSWLHNSQRLVKGKERCAMFIHPSDASEYAITAQSTVKISSAVGSLIVGVKVTDEIKSGVVSIPHGWGHNKTGMKQRHAQANPGINVNDIVDDSILDAVSGNAVFNGVPVSLEVIR